MFVFLQAMPVAYLDDYELPNRPARPSVRHNVNLNVPEPRGMLKGRAHLSTRGGGRMMLDELARPRAVRVLADGRGRGGGLSYSNGGLVE